MMYKIEWKYSPDESSSTSSPFLVFICLLIAFVSSAQPGRDDIDGVVMPGSIDNQIDISAYNPLPLDSIQSVYLDTLKSGRWIYNIRFQPDTLGPIPGLGTASFTVLFDIDPNAHEGAIDSFVLYATAGGALLDHPKQTVVLRISDIPKAGVVAYPLKQDAPPAYTIRDDNEIFQYCATGETQINEYDVVAVYFTPGRALALPEPEKFNYRIINPNGRVVGKGSNVIESTSSGEVYNTDVTLDEDAPGKFVHLLFLGNKHIPEDEAARPYPPGEYAVETIGLEPDAGVGLFGQGQGFEEVGEWQREGTFNVRDGFLHFAGFIAEPADAPMPRTTSRWKGASRIEALNVDKESGRVSLTVDAWWQNTRHEGNDVYRAGDKTYRAETFIDLVFPTKILPGKSQKDPTAPSGAVFDEKPVARVEVVWETSGDDNSIFIPQFFCPGPIVGTPNREFDESGWKARISMNQDLFAYSNNLSRSRIPSKNGKSVFNVGPVNDYEPFGSPPQNLAWHIRESETLWLFPIKFTYSQDHSIDFYAYGVYTTIPGSYESPSLDAPIWASATPADPEEVIAFTDPDIDGHTEDEVEDGQIQEAADISPISTGGIVTTTNQRDPIATIATQSSDELPDAISNEPQSSDLVTVQDYKGIHISEAIGRIRAQGLRPIFTAGPPASKEAEVGIVAEQKQNPGAHLNRGADIDLIVYGAVRLIDVPNLTGLDIREAQRELASRGLTPELEHAGAAPSESLSRRVKESVPCEGAQVKVGSPVRVKVYDNYIPQLVSVPDVQDLLLSDAVARLQDVGLNIKPVIYGPAPSAELSNRVSVQDPSANSEVALGATVELEVYQDYVPQEVIVPNVCGLTRTEAENLIVNSGLQIATVILADAPSADKAHKVQGQHPVSGSTLAAGAIVKIEAWGEYTTPVGRSNHDCVVPVHDLTGSYSEGRLVVNAENGKYVGRGFTHYSEDLRRKGFQYGMVLFKISSQPDITKSLEWGQGNGTYTASYNGKCLNEINGMAAYSDCFVRVGFGSPEHVSGRLKLNYGDLDHYHDTRLEKHAVIQKIPCDTGAAESSPVPASSISESDCLKPSWVRNQSPLPDEKITLCYRNYGCSDWIKDGEKYWFRSEYIIIQGDILKRYDACGNLVRTLKKAGTRPWDGGVIVWEGSDLNDDGTLEGYWWIFGLEN